MGISFPPIRDFICNYIIYDIIPVYKHILDLGCGFGYYGRDIKKLDNTFELTGVEAFEPYLLNKKSWTINYDRIVKEDLRNVIYYNYGDRNFDVYDVVLMMDVIEHFEKSEALDILDKLKSFKKVIISTPLFNYKQGVENNNELEIHKCWFTEKELNDLGFKTLVKIKFPSRKGDIGAFIYVK